MKRIFKYYILIVMSVLLLAGCKKSWLDVNTDPNNPEKATLQLVFPSGVASVASVVGGQYAILGGIWSQYWTQSNSANQYKYIDSYQLLESSFDNQFLRIYSEGLNDLETVIRQSKAQQDWRFYLMATTMQCYTFQVLADLYDQIPMTEALKGTDGILSPHYNTGQEVYDTLIARLDNALSKPLNAQTATDPGTSDFVFGGDTSLWKEFAYTLELKIYLRQMYARPDVAKAGLQKLYGDYQGDFLTEDAAMTQFIDEASQSNPLFEDNNRQLNVGTNLRASTTLLSFLQKNSDPRISSYYLQANGAYKGLGQGDFNAPSTAVGGVDPSTVSVANNTAKDPVQFISAAESYFLQAEAIAYGNSKGLSLTDPNGNSEGDLYALGVEEAFIFAGLTADDADAMTAAGEPYVYPTGGTFEQQQEAIITQKWLSMPGSHALEMVFEHNRTGYPRTSNVYSMLADHSTLNPAYVPGQFVVPPTSVIYNQYPQRLLFPDSERSRNPNTPVEVPITTKVWWNKK